MRRFLLLLVCAATLLGTTNTASAGWFHFGRHFRHVGRHFHGWVHRPHYGHRVHRYRYYAAPRYYSFGYRHFGYHHYAWPRVIRHFVPIYHHYRVRYYYPHCSTYPSYTTPSYSTWSYAQSPTERTAPTLDRERLDLSRLAAAQARTARPGAAREKQPAERSDGMRAMLASLRREAAEWGQASALSWSEMGEDERLVDLGERLFRGRFYEEALKKFDAASARSPASAELQFRRGHALVALGRYGDAAAAFKRALVLNPRFVASGWDLGSLYGSDQHAMLDRHVETLAGAALQASDDPDLLFLIGVSLHFNGQADRAEKFFGQAAESSGEDAPHLTPFLRQESLQQRDKLASTSRPGTVRTAALRR